MDRRCWIYLLIFTFRTLVILADTIPQEAAALTSLATQWENHPRNWVGLDPCGSNWIGITCSNSHIVTITLSNFGLNGTLSGEIQYLVELLALDLSYNPDLGGSLPSTIGNLRKLKNLIVVGCSFTGLIPPEIGNLKRLTFLGLNANRFRGPIPGSFGNLSQLYWFDITDNEFSGTIPISDGNNLGLDMLTNTKHFHFGKNRLSGQIPARLFHSEMSIVHLLFDNNNFSGTIPPTLGLVTSMEAVRLDQNQLSGPVPSNLNNLTRMAELLLSNNELTGSLPNLTGMNALAYVDLSNNSFDVSEVPTWFTTLPSMTTIILEYLTVAGQIPIELFSFPPLQTARLKNNQFNGTLSIATGYSSQLQIIDLQNNKINTFSNGGGYSNELILSGNPVCNQKGSDATYCKTQQQQQQSPPYSTSRSKCVLIVCLSDQVLSPNCSCGYPFAGTIYFRLQMISNLENSTYFEVIESKLLSLFQTNQIPVDSVSVFNPFLDSKNYLQISLQFFPAGKTRFDLIDVLKIANLFSNQTFKGPSFLGPYYFIAQPYFASMEAVPSSKSNNMGAIVGASVGGVAVISILIGVIVFVIHQKRKLEKAVEQSKGVGSWDRSGSSGSIPQITGPRWFSFEELKKYTNNFSEANEIGSGGYGRVYRGTLPNGQLVAVKRSEQGSMQGGLEFKTEIELLSRVHHRNLVTLVGFCSDQGEQMLVYEYVPNGSLKESLSGKSGIHLDWKRRLQVALGAARGLAYLHELCNPPIIHRDVKSNNILLDHNLIAKVSDFGLSKLLGDNKKGHVTTQVKGTAGYVDPEYYMTQQLTEKSDVYSFGVVLLELVTARKPIERGKYIVRQVKRVMDKNKDLYGLHQLLDSAIAHGTTLVGFEDFVNLAMRCVEELGSDRPPMSEVVKEIENIMQMAGLNPNTESTSASYEETGRSRSHPYSDESLFEYGRGHTLPR